MVGSLPSDLILMRARSVLGIPSLDFSVKLPFVLQDDLDFVRILHHMVVGDDEAGLVDDESGTETPLFKSLVWTSSEKFLKKIPERVILFQRVRP